MTDRIPADIDIVLDTLDDRLSRDRNPDMKRRDFCVFRRMAAVYFADGLVSTDFLQHYLLKPCMKNSDSRLDTGEGLLLSPWPAAAAAAIREACNLFTSTCCCFFSF